jgi:hypothetical protein
MAEAISSLQLKQFKQAAAKALAGTGESRLAEPMLPECRVAVLIPVYDESSEILMRPLQSLVDQQNVNFDDFEVVFIVNNNKQEAKQKSPAFLSNQKAIIFLREFKGGGLHIRVIDKSSLQFADKYNHVAHARNRGCLEIALRFCQNGQGARGIMAMTDADCRVSSNYISSLIKVFKYNNQINGVSGAVHNEIDEGLPHFRQVGLAFNAHVGFSGRFSPAAKYKDGLALKKQHKLKYNPLNTGQDLAVSVGAWLMAGGFPNRPSGEDFHFGRLVENLPGDIAVTDAYTVFPLVRISTRTGLAAFGRRVEKISLAVDNFCAGKSRQVWIPDNDLQRELFRQLSRQGLKGSLTGEKTLKLLKQQGCNCAGLEALIMAELAELMNREMANPEDGRNYQEIEDFVAKYLGDRLPLRNITHLFKSML